MKAILLSVILHTGLIAVLFMGDFTTDNKPKINTSAQANVKPIEAVAVDSKKLQQAIDNIKKKKRDEAEAQKKRINTLEKRAKEAAKRRAKEEARIKKLEAQRKKKEQEKKRADQAAKKANAKAAQAEKIRKQKEQEKQKAEDAAAQARSKKLKAEAAGTFEAPASSAYLYYDNEVKSWSLPQPVEIQ